MPQLSVIMPTKNRADLLPETIQSVLDQTLQDWELVVVDDHGTDNTEAVLASFRDQRLRYIRLEEGTGPGRARAFGIDQSKADIICFADSDDINKPERFKLSLTVLGGSKADVVYGDIEVVNINTGGHWSRPSHQFSLELLKRINFIPTPTVMMKKSAYLHSGGFDHSLKTSEDYDLWLKLAIQGSQFHYINQSLVTMRVHENNITKTTGYEQRQKNLFTVRERYSLPVPSQIETLNMINNPQLREIFSTEGAKLFWFNGRED